MAAARLLDVVGELEAGRDGDLDVVERAPGRLGRFPHRVEVGVGGLGHERGADPAVAQFAGEAQVRRTERGVVDRDLGAGDR